MATSILLGHAGHVKRQVLATENVIKLDGLAKDHLGPELKILLILIVFNLVLLLGVIFFNLSVNILNLLFQLG